MVEEEKKRIADAIHNMINDIDKTHLRGIQADMHRCAATCCDNRTASLESVHHCVDDCSVRLLQAQDFVQRQFENFQNRIQRCVMACNDSIIDKVGPNATSTSISRHAPEFEACMKECVDKHLGIIPNVMKQMSEILSKSKENDTNNQSG